MLTQQQRNKVSVIQTPLCMGKCLRKVTPYSQNEMHTRDA